MANLPLVSGQQVIQALERFGFRRVRQRGSHVVLRLDGPSGARGCVVPIHAELARGTLKVILKQAGVSLDDFLLVLR